eukprot:TRINITY_DN5913_c0_g1_i1.p1 TRINITY_DN5913_c0_g1~~TRINITY_DN5913_c0_g1_i1.p1  ORF type:complete len:179 (+),score=37.37 TRINITY_DN5913_c0_g1_i1:350-886(+)
MNLWEIASYCPNQTALETLLKHRVPFDPIFFKYPLEHNDCDAKKLALWVAQQGVPLPDNICDMAALAGVFELVKLAHEAGKPWGERTLGNAINTGDYEGIVYVLEHGAELNGHAMNQAAMLNNVEVLQLLLDRGCPIPDDVEVYIGMGKATKSADLLYPIVLAAREAEKKRLLNVNQQ